MKFLLTKRNRWKFEFLGGAFCISSPQYSSEIAENSIRGTLGASFQLLVITGILFSYVVGSALESVFLLSIICGILPIFFGLVFIFMPESPFYLITKNKDEAGNKSLNWLRGSGFDSQAEVDEIKKEIGKQQEQKSSLKESLMRRSTVKGLIISIGLAVLQQLSGINVVIFYVSDIFKVSPLIGLRFQEFSLNLLVDSKSGNVNRSLINHLGHCTRVGHSASNFDCRQSWKKNSLVNFICYNDRLFDCIGYLLLSGRYEIFRH